MEEKKKPLYIRISPKDNVAITVDEVKKGTEIMAVSYTHLDVYKRQVLEICSALSGNYFADAFAPDS